MSSLEEQLSADWDQSWGFIGLWLRSGFLGGWLSGDRVFSGIPVIFKASPGNSRVIYRATCASDLALSDHFPDVVFCKAYSEGVLVP